MSSTCPYGTIAQGSAAGLAVLVLSLFFHPTCPLAYGPAHCVAQPAGAQLQRAQEISGIHSLLLANETDMPGPSAREAARVIWEESKRYALDPMMVLALIEVESSFRHRAISTKGARGLMQLLPPVAAALVAEVAPEQWRGENSLDDPVINIKLGVFYLARLRDRFKDSAITLTAYNWGPNWVQTNIERKLALPLAYAKKVLSIAQGYRERVASTPDVPRETGDITSGSAWFENWHPFRGYA